MRHGFVIAIDGPAASGKGTMAPLLATKLHGYHLYTGAMYRCVALYCLEQSISPTDQKKITAVLPLMHIDFHDQKVLLNGKDVTERIRERDIDTTVPLVSDIPEVRAAMRRRQQEIGREKVEKGQVVIAEGRDVARFVFPNAAIKLYLTASSEIRAKRRFEQMQEKGFTNLSYEEIVQETIERDNRDMHGKLHYLTDHPEEMGYMVLDNSALTESETLHDILEVIEKKGLLND